MSRWPERLLTQNAELKRAGVWNWSLPAHVVQLSDGTRFNVCPNAGACGRVCYAKFGTYQFSNVKARHRLNLEYVLEEPDAWQRQMLAEVAHKRFNPSGTPHRLPHDRTDMWLSKWVGFGGAAVRVHDGGDFFNDDYIDRWATIANQTPHVLFYAYTKEVSAFKSRTLPRNFRIIYSMGGREDHLIDTDRDRHADVFPTLEALEGAGYFDQSDNDLLAIVAPFTRIGIVANNLPVPNKRFDGRTMSAMRPTNDSSTND